MRERARATAALHLRIIARAPYRAVPPCDKRIAQYFLPWLMFSHGDAVRARACTVGSADVAPTIAVTKTLSYVFPVVTMFNLFPLPVYAAFHLLSFPVLATFHLFAVPGHAAFHLFSSGPRLASHAALRRKKWQVGTGILKYIPQVVLNIRRRSTKGWTIWNVILDLTGGLLSVVQARFCSVSSVAVAICVKIPHLPNAPSCNGCFLSLRSAAVATAAPSVRLKPLAGVTRMTACAFCS